MNRMRIFTLASLIFTALSGCESAAAKNQNLYQQEVEHWREMYRIHSTKMEWLLHDYTEHARIFGTDINSYHYTCKGVDLMIEMRGVLNDMLTQLPDSSASRIVHGYHGNQAFFAKELFQQATASLRYLGKFPDINIECAGMKSWAAPVNKARLTAWNMTLRMLSMKKDHGLSWDDVGIDSATFHREVLVPAWQNDLSKNIGYWTKGEAYAPVNNPSQYAEYATHPDGGKRDLERGFEEGMTCEEMKPVPADTCETVRIAHLHRLEQHRNRERAMVGERM